MQTHFFGAWAKVNTVTCCESGGRVYAMARFQCPRGRRKKKKTEIGRDVIPRGASVCVVVEDVLATGRTLCAVLQLLTEATDGAESVVVMVVAECSFHRGRQLLRKRAFGAAKTQSLLVFDGP